MNSPDRIEALERRVAAVEGKMLPSQMTIPPGRECPKCGKAMEIESERDDPTFGTMGMKLHTLKCPTCKSTATRQFTPGKGYV
jgi:endogenous inhibitor of DNA gyrase (YacG/DUF329 family)